MCPPCPSPLQNRVFPTGEIVADPARGMFTGNRGILPFTDGRLGTSRWKHQHWIICTLTHPKGRYHGPMPARGWTPLFLSASAVVMSLGGPLSHSCIVAREYGIPTVVAVRDATDIISTGDMLTVDGDRGLVYLQDIDEEE